VKILALSVEEAKESMLELYLESLAVELCE
jgi:hypothetical protein